MHLVISFLKVFWRTAFIAVVPGGAIYVLWHDREKLKLLAANAKKNVMSRFQTQKRKESSS